MASRRDQVFLCYSHADADWLDRLRTHLRPLERQGRFPIWHDREIRPGAKWRDEIRTALDRARVAVLLVSPDFLASDYIAERELPEILRAAKDEGVRILWIPVRPSGARWTDLEGIQAVGDPKRALSRMTEPEVDEALVKAVEEVARAYGEVKVRAAGAFRPGHAIVIGLVLAVMAMGVVISLLTRSQRAAPIPVTDVRMPVNEPPTRPEPLKATVPTAPAAPGIINYGSNVVNASGDAKVESVNQSVSKSNNASRSTTK